MRTLLDRATLWYLSAVLAAGLIYVFLQWTPSSYGGVLAQIGAPEAGPVAGAPRPIRADEWALLTPQFQAAVRNGFRRINETSFYREDLRNFEPLPLKDWSLIFKPQMWAFFLLPPATALAIYYAILMCGFLAGYQLLFRELGAPGWLAAAVALIAYFSGFTQFWWTTFAPLLAGLPWILLIVLRPVAWWQKTLLCAWAFPAFVLSHAYPTLLIALAWGSLVLILAFRPLLLRSPGTIGAIVTGGAAVIAAVWAYYIDVIPIMRATVYPGHRISGPGGTPIFAVLSEIWPFLTFRLGDYQHFTGINICEIGALGSFFPLLTLCLARYRSLREHRNVLLTLLAGFVTWTIWQLAPLPAWIGRVLLWNTGDSQRWLFTSGLLLTLACLVVWSRNLISPHPLRIGLFVLMGPVASLVLKILWLLHKGQPVEEASGDAVLCGLAIAAGALVCYIPATVRAPILLTMVVAANVYCFGLFNPIQSAEPIFHTPDTEVVRQLSRDAAKGVLVDPRFTGSTLNGLGFRSVGHTLVAPQLAIFRQYFPAMDPAMFDRFFNRYAYIIPGQYPMPSLASPWMLLVPMEPFLPVHNVRRFATGPFDCSRPGDGGIGPVSAQGGRITIEGWAPWLGEKRDQGIRVSSRRPVQLDALATTTRPEIAERLQDYRMVKAGFKLQLSTADGKPLKPDELSLVAFGTIRGEVRLNGCACR